MPATNDLPDDLHRRRLRSENTEPIGRSEVTGLPTLDLGTAITTESVRELEENA